MAGIPTLTGFFHPSEGGPVGVYGPGDAPMNHRSVEESPASILFLRDISASPEQPVGNRDDHTRELRSASAYIVARGIEEVSRGITQRSGFSWDQILETDEAMRALRPAESPQVPSSLSEVTDGPSRSKTRWSETEIEHLKREAETNPTLTKARLKKIARLFKERTQSAIKQKFRVLRFQIHGSIEAPEVESIPISSSRPKKRPHEETRIDPSAKRIKGAQQEVVSTSSSSDLESYLADEKGRCIPERIFSEERESDDEFDSMDFISRSSSSCRRSSTQYQEEDVDFDGAEASSSHGDVLEDAEEPLSKKCVRARWSEDEIREIKQLIEDKATISQIQEKFPSRSKTAINTMVANIKYPKVSRKLPKSARKDWSKNDIERLIDLVNTGVKKSEVFKIFSDRTRNAINSKLIRLRAEGMIERSKIFTKETSWTEEEDNVLAELYESASPKEIAKLSVFGRSFFACQARIARLREKGKITHRFRSRS